MLNNNGKETPKFTQQDAWTGGFYELALILGERSDKRLFDALVMIWKHPSLDGCYLDHTKEPYEQLRIVPSEELLESGQHLRGLAHLPNGIQVPCGTVPIREDRGIDWLIFYLPMGALQQAYDVGGYPFDIDIKSPESWQKPIDDYLSEIGLYIFAEIQFQLGLIGHEVSTATDEELAKDGIPDERYMGYLLPSQNQINYFPRNKVY
jgi:hypothetical protein